MHAYGKRKIPGRRLFCEGVAARNVGQKVASKRINEQLVSDSQLLIHQTSVLVKIDV